MVALKEILEKTKHLDGDTEVMIASPDGDALTIPGEVEIAEIADREDPGRIAIILGNGTQEYWYAVIRPNKEEEECE